MLRIVTTTLMLSLTFTAYADCFIRSSMSNQTSMRISAVSDVQSLVVPVSATHNKCIVNFRAQIDNEWISAEGENTGLKSLSEAALCRSAMDQGRTQILSRAEGTKIVIDQNMVCTDQPATEIRSVNIGDKVRESEVRPHPNFPNRFNYRGSECRWLVEPEIHNGDLLQRQGIICQSNGNNWVVVDKW